MSKVKGIFVMVPPFLVAIIEVYYLIILPLKTGQNFEITSSQYWALALPVVFGMLVITLMSTWIGYTMIVTKEPMLINYDEAYQEASEIESEKIPEK